MYLKQFKTKRNLKMDLSVHNQLKDHLIKGLSSIQIRMNSALKKLYSLT